MKDYQTANYSTEGYIAQPLDKNSMYLCIGFEARVLEAKRLWNVFHLKTV